MHRGRTRIIGCIGALCAALASGCHQAALTSMDRRGERPGERGARTGAGGAAPSSPSPTEASRAAEREVPVTRFQLGNGLRVVLREAHLSRVVALQAWVEAGAADEGAAEPGLAHACQRLVGDELERRGGALGAAARSWVTPDHAVFQLLLPGRFLDEGLGALGEALARPALDGAALQRQRQALLAALRQAEESPSRAATQALLRAAFQVHPYGRPVAGTVAAVEQLAPRALRDFHGRRYGADRTTLVLVGDFRTAAMRERIERALGTLPRAAEGAHQAARAPEPAQQGLRVFTGEHDGREAQLLLGFRAPPARSPDVAALDVAATLLGDDKEGRLAVEVQRNRQAASAVFAQGYTPRDPGLLLVGAALPPARLAEGARATIGEVLRLAREEVSPAELRRAQALLEADAVYRQETAEGAARRLGFFETSGGGPAAEARYWQLLRELTPARLREILARHLRPELLTIALLQPRPVEVSARGRGRARVLIEALSPREPAQLERMLRAVMAQASAPGATPPGPGDAPSSAGAAGAVVEHRLRSGARLLILQDRSVPVLALHAAWPGGLRAEDERSAGATQLLARLLCRGTRSRSQEQVARELEAAAGSLRSEADESGLDVGVELLSANWERGLQLLSDCLRNPAFPEEELERARREALQRLHAREDDPSAGALRLFLRALYPRHPYRHDPLGTAASVAALSRRRLVELYRRRYGPERMTLAVVGDAAPAQVIARAEALFPPEAEVGDADPPPPPPDPPPASPQQLFRYIGKDQAHLVLGFPGTTQAAPDRFALAVLLEVLGGEGGRLAALRQQRPLYQVSALSLLGAEPGYLAVRLSTSPEQLEAARAAVRDELRRLSDHPVGEGELARARQRLVLAHEAALQRRGALAAALARAEAAGLGWAEPRGYEAAVLRVSAAEVQQAARRYLDEGRAVLAAVLPDRATPAARRASAETTREPPRPAAPQPKVKGKAKLKRGRRG